MSWMNLCAVLVVTTLGKVGLVDHLLVHGLSVSLQGFLFVVVLAHDGLIRLGHNLLHHHLGHTNGALRDLWLVHLRQDLRHENGDLLEEVWLGSCSFMFVVTVSMGSTMAPQPCESMRCVVGLSLVVLVVLRGGRFVSNPQPPPRTEHGCSVGFDWDPPVRRPHPGRMMGTSERQLVCACFRSACVVANVVTDAGGEIVVSCCLSSALLQERCRWRCRSILVDFGTPRVRQVARLTCAELQVQGIRELLRLICGHLLLRLRRQVALVINEELVNAVGDMLVDLTLPILYVVERFLVRGVIVCDDVSCAFSLRLSTYTRILT